MIGLRLLVPGDRLFRSRRGLGVRDSGEGSDMGKANCAAIIAIAVVLVGGAVIHSARRPETSTALIGVVRSTEVRVEPEVTGQLASITVEKGAQVHAGDVLAKLDAVELTAQADQARALRWSRRPRTATMSMPASGLSRSICEGYKSPRPRRVSSMCRRSSPGPARWHGREL